MAGLGFACRQFDFRATLKREPWTRAGECVCRSEHVVDVEAGEKGEMVSGVGS